MITRPRLQLVTLVLIVCLAYTGCAPVGVPPGAEDKYGCQEPPPDTFTSAGVEAHFAQSTFSKVITGAVDIKTNPSVVSLASHAIRSARIRDKIRCLAINRDKFNTAQTIYLDLTNAFLETNPSPEDFIKWQQQNPFPANSVEQIQLLEKEVDKLRGQVETDNQELRTLQERTRERRLTASNQKSFAEELAKGDKDSIAIGYLMGNSESQRFAMDLEEGLKVSGWKTTLMAMSPIGHFLVGVQVAVQNPVKPSVMSLLSALQRIGVPVKVNWSAKANPPIQLDVFQ